MFRNTRKIKLRNRVITTAICVCVLTLGIYLNYKPQEQTESAVNKVQVEKSENQKSNKTKETVTKATEETYLIKEVNGVVKVFLCDEENNKELYLITSIPFDLLSEDDQELFRNGVTIKSEEELGRFLENFDS